MPVKKPVLAETSLLFINLYAKHMGILSKLAYTAIFYGVCISCNKDTGIKPYSFIHVRFDYDIYPIEMENIRGAWNLNEQTATLSAYSYRNERFRLQLTSLNDTGYYPNPAINNIYFTDGLNFDPIALNSGYIHINHLDSNMVTGDFRISLHDEFNGSENKSIIGDFGINIH